MRVMQVPVLAPSGFYNMAYAEWGDPASDRVLVCVHGLTRNRRDFDFLAQALSDRWRVICPDIPGRGDSDYLDNKADYAIPNYIAICAALIARLGVAEVAWLGTSMGGIIGMGLASRPNTPIKRLVVNDIGPFVPGAALKRIGGYVGADVRFADRDHAEAALRASMVSFGIKRDDHWRYVTEISTQPDGEGRLRLRYDPGVAQIFTANMEDIAFWPLWDAITCPVMIVHGVNSDILTAETAAEMTTRGPKARRLEIRDCGHAPMLWEGAEIAAVRAFLEAG